MKELKLFIGLLGIVMVLSSCSGEESGTKIDDTQNVEVELTQEEMNAKTEALISKVMSPEDFDLKLNGDQKWFLEGEPLKKLLQLKQQIYVISGNMENYEIASYNLLGDEILEFLKTIPSVENKGANTEFQKVLKETKNQCVFLMGSNKQEAQVAVINLSILFDEVPNYFMSTEN